jgi:hypothetical protein
MFQIVRASPVYCQITDASIGMSKRCLPMTYLTRGCAHKIAGRLADAEYDGGGDDYFYVTECGNKYLEKAETAEEVAGRAAWAAKIADDEIPF